jgi:excisionase family DNA binding protein
MPERDELLWSLKTPKEVARIMRVGPKTVTRWAKAGRLKVVYTPGGHVRIPQEEVDRMLEGGSDEQD